MSRHPRIQLRRAQLLTFRFAEKGRTSSSIPRRRSRSSPCTIDCGSVPRNSVLESSLRLYSWARFSVALC